MAPSEVDAKQGYFERHEEQAFILKAALMSFVIIVIKWLTSDLLTQAYLVVVFSWFFFLYVLFKGMTSGEGVCHTIKQYISITGVLHTEEDVTKQGKPVFTYVLVLANVAVFYGWTVGISDPAAILNNFAFPPSKPVFWNVLASPVTSMFLHASGAHLWGNMIFLWAFGTVVERRTGWKVFLSIFIVAGIAGSLAYAAIAYIFRGNVMPLVGASGAIAGIMGVFSVRCFFKNMMFPLPFLGILLPIKVKLNSLAVIGLFFSSDLSGGLGQLTGKSVSNVAYWAHLGGMAFGIAVAYYLGMHKKAIEERHLEIGVRTYDRGYGFGKGEHSLRAVLEKDPEHVEALLCLARTKTKLSPTKEGKESYIKAIRVLLRSNPNEASEIYIEFNKQYGMVEAPLLFTLAGIFHRNYNMEMATRCFQSLAISEDTPSDLREKAMFRFASLLEETGQSETAMNYYIKFIETFPDSVMAEKVKKRLEKLHGA